MMSEIHTMNLTSEKRLKILQARVKVSTPKQLEYLIMDTKRRFKSGRLSKTTHDLILNEATINNKEVR